MGDKSPLFPLVNYSSYIFVFSIAVYAGILNDLSEGRHFNMVLEMLLATTLSPLLLSLIWKRPLKVIGWLLVHIHRRNSAHRCRPTMYKTSENRSKRRHSHFVCARSASGHILLNGKKNADQFRYIHRSRARKAARTFQLWATSLKMAKREAHALV